MNWLHAGVDVIQSDLQAAEYHFNEVRNAILVLLTIILLFNYHDAYLNVSHSSCGLDVFTCAG